MSFLDKFFGLDRTPAPAKDTVLLTTVHSNEEQTVIEGLLRSEGIAYGMRERGAGGPVKIIAGYSMYGTDIYVSKAQFEDARALLEATVVEEDAEGNAEEAPTVDAEKDEEDKGEA